MADTSEGKAGAVVPFNQKDYDAYYDNELKESLERGEMYRKAGYIIKLGCGVPRLNPNGSLMLDENGKEMYLPGNEPTEEPDE